MPTFTKEAIRITFLRLLEEKPLAKISVRSICEACGINRNSFYYHYRDIPALIDEIVKSEADALIAAYPTVESLEDCVRAVLTSLSENRRAFLHIYNSVNRDIYERYLMQLCDYVVSTYLTTAFPDAEITDSARLTITRFLRATVYGLASDWAMNGMKEDTAEEIHRLIRTCHGLSDELIERLHTEAP